MNNAVNALRALIEERRELTEEQAFDLFCDVLDGETTIAQNAALAIALRMRGASTSEVAGAVRAMRQKATKLHPKSADYVDIGGAGSSIAGLLHVHVVAACVAAGAGVKAVSHGYGAAQEGRGSAALLAALGLNVKVPHPLVEQSIDQAGLGFLFAELINRGLAHLGPLRTDLGVRTVFELMGPLSNAVNAPAALVGVPEPALMQGAAPVLAAAGVKRACIVCGHGGLDHVAITGPTDVLWSMDGNTRQETVTPEDFGLKTAKLEQVTGGADAREEAEMINGLLGDRVGPRRDVVLLNAAFAITIVEGGEIKQALARAAEAMDSGAALAKLEQVRRLYGGPVG